MTATTANLLWALWTFNL